jgi:hypothetical protein
MSNRIQIVLVNQLNRQLKIAENKENQRLHRELRHRVRKFKLVNDHFDERRDEISISFENYREQIVDAVAINKMRFDLCIDEKIETIVDYEIDHEEIVDDTDEFSERMCSLSNSLLFFSSLYPTNNTDTDNIKFYWVVLFVILLYTHMFMK